MPNLILIRLKNLSFERVFKAIYRRIIIIYYTYCWNFTSLGKKAREKNKNYYNIHKGKRCFIIANGPSLKKTNLKLLKDEITIGMNRIYLIAEEIGFLPNYLVVSDVPIQLKQFTEEYKNVNTDRFYNWLSKKLFKDSNFINYFYPHFKLDFSSDFSKKIGNSKSVTFTCIQLAFYIGFSEVYLIGKDHSYNLKAKPGTNIKADGNEQNHFISGYYKPGQLFGAPDYEEEEYSYKLAKKAFEESGRSIFDATIDGNLNIFEKVDYFSLFKN